MKRLRLQLINVYHVITSTFSNQYLWIGLILTSIASCEIINPAEEIPAYLKVDSVTFSALEFQGTSSQKITDIWLDINGGIQGVYEIPVTFPVLDSGQIKAVISAGIMNNGIAATRVIYPFFFPDTLTLDLDEKEIYPLLPHFTYRPVTKFSFIEDFEAGNILSQISGDSNLVRINDPSQVFEGSYSGYIYLNKEHNLYEGRTSNIYTIPKGSPVYLEMNYKCDQPFEIGLFVTLPGIGSISLYKWVINTKENWNKIYLEMGSELIALQADQMQVQVRADFDTTRLESHIYLDNLKLVNY